MKNKSNCIFCKIIAGEIPCKKIMENKYAIAFLDINPISDGHTLVVPKKHYENYSSCNDNELKGVASLARQVAKLIKNSSLKPNGFNYLSNEGTIAGQEVMHYHFHVIPKYTKDDGFILTYKNKINKKVDEVLKILTSNKK